jgi:hypothetical protein
MVEDRPPHFHNLPRSTDFKAGAAAAATLANVGHHACLPTYCIAAAAAAAA